MVKKTMMNTRGNEAGLIETFIGTAYDNVLLVAQNLEDVIRVSKNIDNLPNDIDHLSEQAVKSEVQKHIDDITKATDEEILRLKSATGGEINLVMEAVRKASSDMNAEIYKTKGELSNIEKSMDSLKVGIKAHEDNLDLMYRQALNKISELDVSVNTKIVLINNVAAQHKSDLSVMYKRYYASLEEATLRHLKRLSNAYEEYDRELSSRVDELVEQVTSESKMYIDLLDSKTKEYSEAVTEWNAKLDKMFKDLSKQVADAVNASNQAKAILDDTITNGIDTFYKLETAIIEHIERVYGEYLDRLKEFSDTYMERIETIVKDLETKLDNYVLKTDVIETVTDYDKAKEDGESSGKVPSIDLLEELLKKAGNGETGQGHTDEEIPDPVQNITINNNNGDWAPVFNLVSGAMFDLSIKENTLKYVDDVHGTKVDKLLDRELKGKAQVLYLSDKDSRIVSLTPTDGSRGQYIIELTRDNDEHSAMIINSNNNERYINFISGFSDNNTKIGKKALVSDEGNQEELLKYVFFVDSDGTIVKDNDYTEITKASFLKAKEELTVGSHFLFSYGVVEDEGNNYYYPEGFDYTVSPAFGIVIGIFGENISVLAVNNDSKEIFTLNIMYRFGEPLGVAFSGMALTELGDHEVFGTIDASKASSFTNHYTGMGVATNSISIELDTSVNVTLEGLTSYIKNAVILKQSFTLSHQDTPVYNAFVPDYVKLSKKARFYKEYNYDSYTRLVCEDAENGKSYSVLLETKYGKDVVVTWFQLGTTNVDLSVKSEYIKPEYCANLDNPYYKGTRIMYNADEGSYLGNYVIEDTPYLMSITIPVDSITDEMRATGDATSLLKRPYVYINKVKVPYKAYLGFKYIDQKVKDVLPNVKGSVLNMPEIPEGSSDGDLNRATVRTTTILVPTIKIPEEFTGMVEIIIPDNGYDHSLGLGVIYTDNGAPKVKGTSPIRELLSLSNYITQFNLMGANDLTISCSFPPKTRKVDQLFQGASDSGARAIIRWKNSMSRVKHLNRIFYYSDVTENYLAGFNLEGLESFTVVFSGCNNIEVLDLSTIYMPNCLEISSPGSGTKLKKIIMPDCPKLEEMSRILNSPVSAKTEVEFPTKPELPNLKRVFAFSDVNFPKDGKYVIDLSFIKPKDPIDFYCEGTGISELHIENILIKTKNSIFDLFTYKSAYFNPPLYPSTVFLNGPNQTQESINNAIEIMNSNIQTIGDDNEKGYYPLGITLVIPTRMEIPEVINTSLTVIKEDMK